MLRIETEESLEIVSPGANGTPDVQDIISIQKVVMGFYEAAKEGQWASIASGPTYGELHGLTNLVESLRCRWVIFRCAEDEYCLYITPVSKSTSARKASDFPEEAHGLSRLLAEGIAANGYKVAKTSPTSLNWLRPCESLIKEYGIEECTKVAEVALNHDFWSSNIRSPAKLKKHFDVLQVESKKISKPASHKPPKSDRADAVQAGIDKFYQTQATEEDPF